MPGSHEHPHRPGPGAGHPMGPARPIDGSDPRLARRHHLGRRPSADRLLHLRRSARPCRRHRRWAEAVPFAGEARHLPRADRGCGPAAHLGSQINRRRRVPRRPRPDHPDRGRRRPGHFPLSAVALGMAHIPAFRTTLRTRSLPVADIIVFALAAAAAGGVERERNSDRAGRPALGEPAHELSRPPGPVGADHHLLARPVPPRTFPASVPSSPSERERGIEAHQRHQDSLRFRCAREGTLERGL